MPARAAFPLPPRAAPVAAPSPAGPVQLPATLWSRLARPALAYGLPSGTWVLGRDSTVPVRVGGQPAADVVLGRSMPGPGGLRQGGPVPSCASAARPGHATGATVTVAADAPLEGNVLAVPRALVAPVTGVRHACLDAGRDLLVALWRASTTSGSGCDERDLGPPEVHRCPGGDRCAALGVAANAAAEAADGSLALVLNGPESPSGGYAAALTVGRPHEPVLRPDVGRAGDNPV